MELNLADKVAVVTGASRGIGLAITRALAAEGVRVVAGARKGSSELDVLADQKDVSRVLVDLTTVDGPVALIAEAVGRFDAIDILINNVGAVRPRLGGFLDVSDQDWDSAMTINFFAAARTMRAALPHLATRGGASIVTISSVNAFLPDPSVIDYSAAKAALTNLCKSLSKEYGGTVRVNTISPGPVQTDLWLGDDGVAATVAQAQGTTAEAVARQAAGEAATGRFSYPHEIADLALFLASDRAANITGANVTIDGGLITTT
ncbi:MAG TPA: SDR family oxidoreductase [Mycobacteriales bacterium]|jgi:NAD(P)-dependent dehydrogenase (short-subunit alcohol dehydrogenase family)|nr:SDR family oxidoreductase [Mycobacteriales bacterium]